MASPVQQSSSEDVSSLNKRWGVDNGEWLPTAMISDGTIVGETYYDGPTARITKTLYFASHKKLDALAAVGNWVGSADEDSTAVNTNGWMDGTAEVLRVTYTYSTGTATITDATTNHGDLSSYVGNGCTTGYVTVLMKYSDYSNVTAVQLRFGSSSSAYRAVSINGGGVSNSWIANSVWVGLIFDLSTGASTGSPLGTGVDYVQFNWTVASGTSKTIDLKDLYVVGVDYANTTDETSNKVTGSDFDNLRRQVINLVYEGKTAFTEEYVYEGEHESIISRHKSGGY